MNEKNNSCQQELCQCNRLYSRRRVAATPNTAIICGWRRMQLQMQRVQSST
uniref:Candidate secreted effector n=1 Tax=Meloidogyne incognita TaxID=6306 RepID=A0A914MJJ6_MELIC